VPVVVQVLALVVLGGARNRVKAQLRRVRQPRYLVATAVGLLYWVFYFGQFVLGRAVRGGGPRPPGGAPGLELGIALLGLVFLSFHWVFGGDRAAIAFSEAEVQLLFPAPLSRRQLLHYRLLRGLAASLLGAAFTALVLGRGLSGRPVLFALGAWVAFSALSFHGVAAALTRASLAEAGLAGLRRRIVTISGLALALALLAWAARDVAPPGPFRPTPEYLAGWAAAIDGSALGTVLWPVRAPLRLALARDAAAFVAAAPGALLVLALLYAWVMSSAAQFEEASLEAAEARARHVEALCGRGGPAAYRADKVRRPPFALGADGPPEVAFLWKGLIASGRALGSRRTLVVAAGLGGGVTIATGVIAAQSGEVRVGIGTLAVTLWVLAVLVGPRLARADLRADAASLELLRALPLRGVRIVRGALLAPALTLALAQWILLPFMAAGLTALAEGGGGAITAFVIAAAVLGPAVTLALLAIQTGLVVLLPAWAGAADRPRGPEALGTNVLVGLVNLLALAVAALPALVVAGALAFALAPLAGARTAGVAASAAAALVLVGEVWLATRGIGAAFDRIDPSEP
jgi:ABC-2 type transport system permease protein